LKRFWNGQDELERLLSDRPAPPPRLVDTVLRQFGMATPGRERSPFRLGLAAAVSGASSTFSSKGLVKGPSLLRKWMTPW